METALERAVQGLGGGDTKVSKTPDTCGRLGGVSRSASVSSKPGHHTGT